MREGSQEEGVLDITKFSLSCKGMKWWPKRYFGGGGRKKDRERKELKTIILIVGINNSVSYFTSHSDENLWTVSCTPSEISQHWAQRNYLFLTYSSAKVGFIWLIRRRKRKINTLSSPLVKALAWDRGREGFNFPSKQLFQYFYKIQQGKKAIKKPSSWAVCLFWILKTSPESSLTRKSPDPDPPACPHPGLCPSSLHCPSCHSFILSWPGRTTQDWWNCCI